MCSEYRDLRTCLALLLLLSFTLGGCAFGTREAMLRYPPQSEGGAIPAAHAATTPQFKKTKILLLTFSDQRQDKQIVGAVRNGFGMHTATVVALNDVQEWVSEAVKRELTNAGYAVTTQSAGSQSLATLSGDIIEVFCEAYFKYRGQVSLDVKVSKNGKDILNKLYVGKGSAGTNWAATSDAYAQSLSLALADALKHMVVDLNASLQAD